MAGATITEQQGLQRAIALAIEKEDRALGRIVGNTTTITTYVAVIMIAGKFQEFKSKNAQAFKDMVLAMQTKFPLKKITIFEQIEKKPIGKL
jgi:hypothetical protein